jgi:hypothetical protein
MRVFWELHSFYEKAFSDSHIGHVTIFQLFSTEFTVYYKRVFAVLEWSRNKYLVQQPVYLWWQGSTGHF